jgi:hypothetical protein
MIHRNLSNGENWKAQNIGGSDYEESGKRAHEKKARSSLFIEQKK